MKKFISLILILIFCMMLLFCSGCSAEGKSAIQIFDSAGEKIANANMGSDNILEFSNNDQREYLEIVSAEALDVVAKIRGTTKEKAFKYLVQKNCSIYTVFDNDVYNALENGYKSLNAQELLFGSSVTDLQGNLLAVYSSKINDDFINYCTVNIPPYSSFKPLCVYTPAIENSLISWSSVYLDSPIKQLKDENGSLYDWPSNATNTYSNENENIAYAIKTSLNTVAVKCMQDVGVNNSFEFLEEKFGLKLDYEKEKAQIYGEEEVIGNVALGYLYDGVSTVDMAGYYQVFANGGKYVKPHTIEKICDNDGNIIYEYKCEEKQVIKPSTAYIMNRLLQNVVTPGGTGAKAMSTDVAVGGKTGTGDMGNWFVGFTPEYSCAIWHGNELLNNNSCEVFANVISNLKNDSEKQFPDYNGIEKAAYCVESGMLFSPQCKKADMGYYILGSVPEICNKH